MSNEIPHPDWKTRFTDFETDKMLPWWKAPTGRVNRFLMRGATRLGDGLLWAFVAPVLVWDRGWSTAWSVAWRATLVGVASVLLYKWLKNTFNRPRPFERNQLEPLQPPPDRFSFPSGHAMNNMAVSLTIGHLLPDYLKFLLPVAVLVAFSRVYLRVHYPTDVLVGTLLGFGMANLFLHIPLIAHL